jgi:O-antigen ligase
LGYGYQATTHHKQIGIPAHNDWLELLVDNGIVGALVYALIFILLFKMIIKEKNIQKRYLLLAIASIWLLKSMFSMSFTDDITYTLFLLFGYVTQKEESVISNQQNIQAIT